MRSGAVRAAAVLAAVLMIMGVIAETAGPASARARLVSGRSFADPSIIPFRGGYFGLSTGDDAPGAWAPSADGPWQSTGPALAHAPHWAQNAGVWAADAAHLGGRYVMYYSVPVRGLGSGGRCIGAAVARSPLGRFAPVHGDHPLVCPGAAEARRASDGVRSASSRLPHRGVIDPSVTTLGHRSFLLYKTQGTPATIRIVRLSRKGLRTRGRSHQVLETRGISENPVIVRHGRAYYLFTSAGSYASCGYATTWRRSRSLRSWQASSVHTLLRSRSGVCGPGGADVVRRSGRGSLVFFHGWVCGRSHACSNHGVTHDGSARRGLYAGRLVWHRGVPHVVRLGTVHHGAKKHHHAKHHAKKKHHAKRHHPKKKHGHGKRKHHRHGTKKHPKRKHRAHHHKHRRHHAKKRVKRRRRR